MPTLEVGIRESASDADATPEMIPQKGDLLGPGETLSARSWQVLDAGNEDDEDDNYALDAHQLPARSRRCRSAQYGRARSRGRHPDRG